MRGTLSPYNKLLFCAGVILVIMLVFPVAAVSNSSLFSGAGGYELNDSSITVSRSLIIDRDSSEASLIVRSKTGDDFVMTLFDMGGSIVNRLKGKEISWDGRAISGRPVRPGVYYYVIISESQSHKGFIRVLYRE